MKQTAVEWLIEQISFKNSYDERLNIWNKDKDLSDFFDKAKEMEKQQIIDAHIEGQPFATCISHKAEQYYNETFK